MNLQVKVGGGSPTLSEQVIFTDCPTNTIWSLTGWICNAGSTAEGGEREREEGREREESNPERMGHIFTTHTLFKHPISKDLPRKAELLMVTKSCAWLQVWLGQVIYLKTYSALCGK